MVDEPDGLRNLLRDEARRCVRRRILPRASPHMGDAGTLARSLAAMGDAGFLGILIPTLYGGEGGGWQEAAIVVEETARGEPLLAMMLAAHLTCCSGILRWGDADRKGRFLPPLAGGERLGGVALTEPEAGTDYTAVRTRAERRGGRLVVNGNKCFVTNTGPGLQSGILAICRGERGLAAIYLPCDSPGLHLAHRYRFAGWDHLPNHAVLLQDCTVPADNLLREDLDRADLETLLDGARLLTSATAGGMATACLEEASAYARERRQGGKRIIDHQALHFRLADMATSVELMRNSLTLAASRLEAGVDCHHEMNMLTLFAVTRLEEIASAAVETAGAYGYTVDCRLSELYRDAKGLQLFWGSRDLLRLEIAGGLFPEGL